MEAEACGHTYMHPEDRYSTTAALLESISLQDVNAIARELCEHLSHADPLLGVVPAAVVACAPVIDRSGIVLSAFCGNCHTFLSISSYLSPIKSTFLNLNMN